ncbi:MAG: hypothetical protein IPK82_14080 [Polyangiaceae bacterium]|nr:hypothetical protein [Polyangiaceae bacterium]
MASEPDETGKVEETAPDDVGVLEPTVVPPAVEETAPDVPPVAPTEELKPRKKVRWGLRIGGAFLGILLGVGVAIVLLAPGYVRDRVTEEARARGLNLTFQDLDLGLSKLVIEGAQLGFVGAPNVEVSAFRIEVELTDFEPKSIAVHGLSMGLSGTGVLDELTTWKARYPAALAIPLSIDHANLEFRLVKSGPSILVMGNSKMVVDATKGSVESQQTAFLGRQAGAFGISWLSPDDALVVNVEPRDAPLSAVKATVRTTKERPEVKLTLAKTPLGPLQKALGIPRGSEGIEAEGELTMPLPSLEKPTPVHGAIHMIVKGFVVPHPRELDGILFGETTKVKAEFDLSADLSTAKLSQVQVEAGALTLRGLGNVEREGLDAAVSLTLKGSIPCTSLATSAAMAHLGSAWGRLAGGLASGALKGNVNVVITVEAKASDIQNAKIDKSARVGCKVSVPGLPTIVLQ